MPASAPTILATSMGFASRGRGPYDWRPGPVFDLAFELAGAPERPRLCYLGTATGDDPPASPASTAPSPAAPSRSATSACSRCRRCRRPGAPARRRTSIWVGGGSVANLLAVWRVHGLDEIFREVWEAGVVLGGVSAGSLCWHVGGTTDSFGPDLQPVTNGLGLIPTSNGVHYDSEEQRRPLYHRLVADGTLPGGARHRRRRRAGLPRHRPGRGRGRPARTSPPTGWSAGRTALPPRPAWKPAVSPSARAVSTCHRQVASGKLTSWIRPRPDLRTTLLRSAARGGGQGRRR